MIKEVDFIISSRYHALVHAFKLHIPCIAIGWADKYESLLFDVGQQDYLIDARKGIDVETVKSLIDRMEVFRDTESKMICNKLAVIQKNNCFAVFDDRSLTIEILEQDKKRDQRIKINRKEHSNA